MAYNMITAHRAGCSGWGDNGSSAKKLVRGENFASVMQVARRILDSRQWNQSSQLQ